MQTSIPPVAERSHLAQLPGRVTSLDGLRGVASVLVLLFHYFPNLMSPHPGAPLAYVGRVLSLGWTGVDLFFVLSGFLIAGILLDAKESPHFFQTFYIRRICRIFPLYYLLLLIYSFAVWFAKTDWFHLLSGSPALWWYFPFWQNFAMVGAFFAPSNGPWMGGISMSGTWSLAIEEQFYLVLPAAVKRIRKRHTLVAVTVLLFLIAPLLRLVLQARFGENGKLVNYVLPFTRMDALCAGVLLACAYRSRWWTMVARAHGYLLAISGVLVGALLWRHLEMGPFSYTLYAVFYGALLVSALTRAAGWWTQFLGTRVMRDLGKMSYSTYLFHLPVLHLCFGWMRGTLPTLSAARDFAPITLALSLSLLLSWMSFRYFETPFMRWGHRYSY